MPFVLDADDRFYLHRYFDYERRLARTLTRRAPGVIAPAGADLPAHVADLLATLFPRAAVESGAVFAKLSGNPRFSEARVNQLARVCGVPPGVIQQARRDPGLGLTDSVVWLRHNYRFGRESSIGRLAEEINAGDPGAALARLRSASSPSLTWLDDASLIPSPGVIVTRCARGILAISTRAGLRCSMRAR
jgi:hypothetical protein